MINTSSASLLNQWRGFHFLAMLAVGLLAAAAARAERAPMSPEELQRRATHIVIGQVTAVYAKTLPMKEGFRDTQFVAEVRPEKFEKGTAPAEMPLLYVRYWKREWAGIGFPPPGPSGYWGAPKEGERLRLYLTREGYHGFGDTKDGGFTVLGPNGFERESLPPPAASPAPPRSSGGK